MITTKTLAVKRSGQAFLMVKNMLMPGLLMMTPFLLVKDLVTTFQWQLREH
jgi:hypothetical protein